MTSKLDIRGAYTALLTPFTDDGTSLDTEAFEALVRAQLDAGIHGLVPCGTTGESPTLSESEQRDVVAHTVRLAAGRVPVVAGVGSNSTAKTVHMARIAVEAGADAVMVVMPYYNKPSQEGLFLHVTTAARAVPETPVVVYNIPARSVVDLSVDTLARIVDATPNVVAVKEATGNILRCQQIVGRFGDALTVMSGDDALTLGMMACGARGVISVTSNVYPAQVAAVCHAMLEGDVRKAQRLHMALLPIHEAMFVEPNPTPAKLALAHRGSMRATVRLPLSPATDATRARVLEAMTSYEEESRA